MPDEMTGRIYPLTNLCKWGVIRRAPLSPSATDELVAAFELKKDAHRWKIENFGSERGASRGSMYVVRKLVK